MTMLEEILADLGLSEHLAAFQGNDIDDSLLLELSADDLKEIGITSLGQRKKILAAIAGKNPDNQNTSPAEKFTGNNQVEPRISEAPGEYLAERREVTTVFADLTAFTKLSRELDTEDMHNLLSVFYEKFDGLVKHLGGTIERHIGDCVMAVFGAPVSYGNDAEHALRASMEMHKIMAEMSSEMGRELSVHIGVASGNVMFSAQGRGALKELDFSLTGDSVNLASRLADQAEAQQTLITERIRSTLGDQISCDSSDEIHVKGFDEAIPVHRFLGFTSQTVSQPVIGRTEEIDFFQDAISDCLSSGKGETIALVAEAGLGKSCLVEEYERIARLEGFEAHKSLVLDFGLTDSQDPIRSIFTGLCHIDDQDPASIARQVAEIDFTGMDEQLALFLTVLSGGELDHASQLVYEAMGDEVRFDGMRRLIMQLLERHASTQPLLIVVEDLHWSGRETLDQLALIAAATKTARILLVVTLRPQDDPLDEAWHELSDYAECKRLILKPLKAEDSLQLAQRIANPLSEKLIQACIERAEGNPLFLDQLLRHASDTAGEDVPASIQSIVQAKLDRLEMLDRQILEGAAVMGQRFTLNDVQAVIEMEHLDVTHLVEGDLIRALQRGYLFAHALIRDAVLRTILRDKLKKLHLTAASLFKGKDLVLYAEHLAAAQDDKAAESYLEAARQAVARHRKETALSLAQRGLLQQASAEIKISLLTLKGDMLRDLGRGEESIEAFEEIITLTELPLDRCHAQLGIIATMRIMDRIDDAFTLLDEVEATAEAESLILELSEIHYYRGSLHFPRGNLAECLEEHTKSLDYAERSQIPERSALALSGLGDAHYARGRMFTAHKVIEECLQLCDENHLLAVKSANRFMLATVKIYLNETERALEEARASSELAGTVGQVRAEIVSRLTTGWILASMNRLDEAQAEIETGLELAAELGAKRFEPFLEETLAEIALVAGDRDKAGVIAEAALDKLRQLDAMTFIGPWVLSTAARATADASRRAELLAEGESLLATGCVGHNYYRFYKNAIEACIDAQEWQEARRYADCLQDYTRKEPTPWSDFFIDRAHAIIDAETGKGSRKQIESLIAKAESANLHAAVEGLNNALKGI